MVETQIGMFVSLKITETQYKLLWLIFLLKQQKISLAKVTIDGGEKSQCRSTIQVLNTADQINLQKSFNITTTSSNLIFRMNAFFDEPGENPNQVEITRAPGGSAEFVFWIQNDGVFMGILKKIML